MKQDGHATKQNNCKAGDLESNYHKLSLYKFLQSFIFALCNKGCYGRLIKIWGLISFKGTEE